MRRQYLAGPLWLFLVALSAFAAGCRPEQVTVTATVPTIAELPPIALEVPITSLLRNPYSFEGEYIRITGLYNALPLMACKNDPHTAPASWTLSDGEYFIPAAGFDPELRELGVPDIPLVVEGRWQYWEGPVGCGRRSPSWLVTS